MRRCGASDPCRQLKKVWDEMKAGTEETGAMHVRTASQLLVDVEQPMKQLREEQLKRKRSIEDAVRRSNKTKTGQYQALIRVR